MGGIIPQNSIDYIEVSLEQMSDDLSEIKEAIKGIDNSLKKLVEFFCNR